MYLGAGRLMSNPGHSHQDGLRCKRRHGVKQGYLSKNLNKAITGSLCRMPLRRAQLPLFSASAPIWAMKANTKNLFICPCASSSASNKVTRLGYCTSASFIIICYFIKNVKGGAVYINQALCRKFSFKR